MSIALYQNKFNEYFDSPEIQKGIEDAVNLLLGKKRIFFIGNGGSNSICSHYMEDYAKIGRFQTFAFSDAALITCYANDYGYEQAMMEWVKVHWQEGDVLIAISSSGSSKNILNAAQFVTDQNGTLITISGFKPDNPLSKMGEINFNTPIDNYGIVENFHSVILHVILDLIHARNK
jgi:D-sedoheptulose 7-phosphate isomerase